MITLAYTTKPCPVCGLTSDVEVDPNGFQEWKAGALIQKALPGLTPDERELLISGTHPACWEKLWGDDKDVWTEL